MPLSLDEMLKDLGVDPAKVAPELATKYRTHFTDAETKHAEAAQAIAQAQREQAAINDQIARFGVTETTVAELRTANAAYKAAMDAAKESGFKFDLSGIPIPKEAPAVDPLKQMQSRYDQAFRHMGEALRVQAKYQSVFGKPFGDDVTKLVDEAIAAKLPVEQYAEQKYKFAEASDRAAQERTALREKEVAAAAVAKYKEENPIRTPMDRPGLASRHPAILVKPRTMEDRKSYSQMPAKERLANSVQKYRQIAAEQTA